MTDPVTLRLKAKPLPAELPPMFKTALGDTRGGTESANAPDPFFPPGYLKPKSTFDVAAATRGNAEGVEESAVGVQDDEILVIEMADRSTLVTTAAKLKASLEVSQPQFLGPDGEILFDKIRLDGTASRGVLTNVVGGLVGKVYTLAVGVASDPIIDEAKIEVAKLGGNAADIGVSWLGTKALMWAIEKRLRAAPGTLSKWVGGRSSETALEPLDAKASAELTDAANSVPPKPILVFLHGTASTTVGSFGDLHAGDRDVWSALDRYYGGRIYAFEHHTLSKSPIENALQLVEALPQGSHVSMVSHSRGGLVGDLLCLEDFDSLIPNYRSDVPGTGDASTEADRVQRDLGSAHEDQRKLLRKLAASMRDRKLVIERYVRVASPARGTKLASGNFDIFLSGLLTLIGQVPFFFGQPEYMAFKRVVLEIARKRTNPHLVPGIEAMLPDAPMARLLRDAKVQPGVQLALIAGDIDGGHLLQRLGVMLTDFLLFENVDNDLVVDTGAMLAGIAPQAKARALFDRGTDVSHFRYFSNLDTRFALRDWLVSKDLTRLDAFQPLPDDLDESDTLEGEDRRLREVNLRRGTEPASLPVVVILPGVMGSHLWLNRRDRIWFDPFDIAKGGLAKIAWDRNGVEAEKLFGGLYGQLSEHLAVSHRVERFAYDWRQPLDVLGERFGEYLATLLQRTDRPIRLLAHSMGGLVVRACIYRRRSVMDELMKRDGARFVMLGTPNQGAHSMVENLLGKGDTLRSLVRVDLKHDMQQVLDIVAAFRGPLQLLPRPGFVDTFQGVEGGGMTERDGARYDQAATWTTFKEQVKDLWFGNGRCAMPPQEVLNAGTWLWKQDNEASGKAQRDAPALPESYESKTVYVFGVAPNTPCGVRLERERLKMVGTARGDGTVTWDSGRIGGIGKFYYMPVEHGALPSTKEYFEALADLLNSGATGKLMTTAPAVRAIEQSRPVTYDAGPPVIDAGQALAKGFMGGAPQTRLAARPRRRLQVAIKAMDLRFLNAPILVGHYEHDPIAGPEKLIDRELLDGDLSQRYSLGLYAGPRGTATVVLRAPNKQERQRGSLSGAVVTGLGPYEKPMSLGDLTESVRAGVLRYLLQVIDVLGKQECEVRLATLLIGFNSSANLTVADSVEALVRGVLEANAKFFETSRLSIRVSHLDIVELYLDTAITAVYALRQLSGKLNAIAAKQRSSLICASELIEGEGVRQRLFDRGSLSYWPRLIITDADKRGDLCPPECFEMKQRLKGGASSSLRASDQQTAGDADAAAAADSSPSPRQPRSRTAVADRLAFVYVGQRARAESIVHQRQPGLIEAVVRQQIASPTWNEDIGRMLFQLMVPHDFKDAARQLDRVMLVVDGYTANLPWELMSADQVDGSSEKAPLALRTPVVRQLEAPRFRRHVRQNFERKALVIGNPSVKGFAEAFGLSKDPEPLSGAEQEALSVTTVLSAMDYTVTREIGEDRLASDVLAALYRQPYRFLHISAHGVFDLRHADGRHRSGVVLSDGLLLTAAEIDAMENVPELVFLNCCHLGKVDATVRDGNRLAASVARELIQIGVRCVIVAGWAVDDRGAKLFGETFYRQLLLERRAFGEAVFEARKAVWNETPTDITWGAFQAYGDAGWMAEPVRDGSGRTSKGDFASIEEVLDELASLRANISRKTTRLTQRETDVETRAIEQLKDRMPAGWLGMPALQSALGRTWADLGQFEKACAAYLAAVQAEDRHGQVPIRDIEQLAYVEAKLGEQKLDEAQIRRALQRLDELDRLVSLSASNDAAPMHSERSALRGGAWKRLASLYARRVLAEDASPDAVHEAGEQMRTALQESASVYQRAEGLPGRPQFNPYHALGRLALFALSPPAEGNEDAAAQRDAALALVQQCVTSAEDGFRRDGDFFNAVMSPETLLVRRLLDQSLGAEDDRGAQALEEISSAYAEALSNITVKPRELEAVIDQLCLLSRFHDAFAVIEAHDHGRRASSDTSKHSRMATRLIALAERLQPGACKLSERAGPKGRTLPSSGSTPGAGAASDDASVPADAAAPLGSARLATPSPSTDASTQAASPNDPAASPPARKATAAKKIRTKGRSS